MGYRLFDFRNVPWTPGSHPLERKRAIEGAPAVEISFEPGFHDPSACRSGHAGYVLEGTLAIDFDAGDPLIVQAGSGFLVDAGTPHRARNPGAGAVRLFIYSWRD